MNIENDNDYLKLKNIIHKENKVLLEEVKKWTKETHVTKKEFYEWKMNIKDEENLLYIKIDKEISDLKDKHINPIKVKIYGTIWAVTSILGFLQIYLK